MCKESRQDTRRKVLEDSDLRTLLVLERIDKIFASIAGELMRYHCPDGIIDSFNDVWEELKRLIQNIQLENNHDEQKN